jgi:hypothetical protein
MMRPLQRQRLAWLDIAVGGVLRPLFSLLSGESGRKPLGPKEQEWNFFGQVSLGKAVFILVCFLED